MEQSQSLVSEIPTVFEQEVDYGVKENSPVADPEKLETVDSAVTEGNSRQELKKSAISFQDKASFRSIDLQASTGAKKYRTSQGVSPISPLASKILYKNKHITLAEDIFGTIFDENLLATQVKRYTWKNYNNIEVQIINYGARITSIKIPDKKGNVQDIVLGFDTLEGYVQHERYYFGATIGRMTGPVENSTYVIDGIQYWISSNDGKHHVNGGFFGLDKAVWNSVVNKNKVIFSYILPDGHEGFVGDLLVEITFELSDTNEFSINIEARCTQTTIINLSNLCYFNLAGQNGGVNELRKHIVTINSCNHIVTGSNNLPTGKTAKSVFTRYDFQIPKVLNKCMDIDDQLNRGFDQYFCIDKDEGEDVCFVARALHTPSGRTLEIYSNQYAVRFTTANSLDGKTSSLLKNVSISGDNTYEQLFTDNNDYDSNQNEKLLYLVEVYETLKDLQSLHKENFSEHLNLFRKLYSCNIPNIKSHLCNTVLFKQANIDFKFFVIAMIQVTGVIKNYIPPSIIEQTETWNELQNFIDKISVVFTKLNELVMAFTQQVNINFSQTEMSEEKTANTLKELERNLEDAINSHIDKNGTRNVMKTTSSSLGSKASARKNIVPWLWEELMDRVVRTVLSRAYSKTSSNPSIVVGRIKSIQSTKIIGKQGAVYRKCTGMAFQTQNYPNAIYHKNFPSCKLRPNEVYNHKIIYKFWVQSGNPAKWMKRYESQ